MSEQTAGRTEADAPSPHDDEPAQVPHPDARRGPGGPSAPTVVFGLVLGVVAALLLGHETNLFEVDPVASGVWLLLGSGALLVVWAVVSMVGRRGADATQHDTSEHDAQSR